MGVVEVAIHNGRDRGGLFGLGFRGNLNCGDKEWPQVRLRIFQNESLGGQHNNGKGLYMGGYEKATYIWAI